jgi:hypothetical protein
MKLFLCALFVVTSSAAPVFAAVEQCRFIQATADREACYERQDRALAAKRASRAAADARPIEPAQPMSLEDDALKRTLRGICRGC